MHLHGGHPEKTAPLCDVLAALTACAGGSPTWIGADSPIRQVFFTTLDTPRPAQAPPFLAQGPPAAA